jgi:hypothetical protein
MYKRRLSFLVILLPFFAFSQITMVELDVRTVPEPRTRNKPVDEWNSSQPGFNKLTEQAKDFYYWTNYSRQNPKMFWDSVVVPMLEVFPTLNKAEAKSLQKDLSSREPLPMFILNPALIQTAQLHALDIGRNKSPISHNSSDGTDFGTRIKRAGIRKCANENISVASQTVSLALVLLYLDIGLPSLGHRKALTDANLREIGIGASRYGKDQWFLVQDMACLQQ